MKQIYAPLHHIPKAIRQFAGLLGLMLFSFLAPVKSYGQNVLDMAGLDASVTVEAAYSIRKLSSSYSGPAITVRRVAGSPLTTDIGFTASGDLDTSALKTFAEPTGTVYVTKWYDQSGRGRDVAQTAPLKQPMIVNAGFIYYNDGRPAIWFDGASTGTTSKTLFNNFSSQVINYPVSLSIV
ncbi:MAG: hypothetical protein EOP51_25355, partial [Sphingobacteriales bacterium]